MGEEVAHEAVVIYREPSQPNPGYNEAANPPHPAILARLKGKKCLLIENGLFLKVFAVTFC